jgi:hypothetical protein
MMNSIKKQLTKMSWPSWLPSWFSPPIALISGVGSLLASFLAPGTVRADIVHEGGDARLSDPEPMAVDPISPPDSPETTVDPVLPADDLWNAPLPDPPVTVDPLPPLNDPWSAPVLYTETGDTLHLGNGNGISSEYGYGPDLDVNAVSYEMDINTDSLPPSYPSELPSGNSNGIFGEYVDGPDLDNNGRPDEIGINPDSLHSIYPGGVPDGNSNGIPSEYGNGSDLDPSGVPYETDITTDTSQPVYPIWDPTSSIDWPAGSNGILQWNSNVNYWIANEYGDVPDLNHNGGLYESGIIPDTMEASYPNQGGDQVLVWIF